MNTKQKAMTEGAIGKQIVYFAIPILISSLFQQLYNTVDSAVVGSVEGTTALGAVGAASPLINLLVGLFLGIAAGASAVIAHYFGAKDKKNVEKSVHTAIAIGLISGIILSIVGVSFSRLLLKLIKTPDDVFNLSNTYLVIYFAGVLPMMMYNIGAGILQAVGDSRRPLFYLIASGITNMILDVIFVALFHWGVPGTAWATVLSQIVSCFLVLFRLIHSQEIYHVSIKNIRIHSDQLIRILKIGIPAGMQSVMFSLANALLQRYINDFGSAALAGCTAYYKIDAFLYLPCSSFGIATMTFVSQNIGANKLDRVKKGTRIAMGWAFLSSVIIIAIVLLLGYPIISFVTKHDKEAIDYGIKMMYILAPFSLIYSFIEIFSGFLRGVGASSESLIITAITICGIRVLWTIIMMPIVHSIYIVYVSFPISWFLCVVVYLIYYLSRHWMKYIKKTEKEAIEL